MDSIMSFTLEGAQLRGNYIACDTAIQEIITAHNYPDIVNRLLAQAITLAFALANTIKYDGVFSLQLRSDDKTSPIKTLFVAITSDKQARAYAVYNEETIKTATLTNDSLFKKGLMLFSVSQIGKEPYQGVVEMTGETLKDTVLSYFNQSEQIATDILLKEENNLVRLIMLQQMPLKEGVSQETLDDIKETAHVLLHSASDKELFDATLPPEKLLYRLFHANDLVVFNPVLPTFFCPCYRDKMYQFLKNMTDSERENLYQDGVITAECQFCGKKYTFTKKDFI